MNIKQDLIVQNRGTQMTDDWTPLYWFYIRN